MGFWIQLAIWAVLTILGEVLRPRPELEDAKATTFDEFGVPTTDPKRAIPVIWGRTRIESPGIVWYGDYRTEAIEEEVRTGLFSKDQFISGYNYFIGVQLGVARAVDTYERFDWDEETLISFSPNDAPPDAGTLVSVNFPDFLGGDEGPGAGGGIVGDFRFFKGGLTQATSAYLSLFQTPLTAYRHLAYVLLEGVNIGTQASIKLPAIVCSRIPNQLALTGGKQQVGNSANAAAVIYELMIDDDFGLNIDATDINAANFRSIGDQLFVETHGYANKWTQKAQVKDVIDDILRQIDGTLFLDFESGQFEMRLVRGFDETSPEGSTLVTLNESNIVELEEFTRASYAETSNRVVVNWKDPDQTGNPSPAIQDDMANQRIQNRNVVATFNYVGIDNATLAAQVAARELRALSFPLAKTSFVALRDAVRLRPGDAFELQWADLGIVTMNMRVTSIAIGDSVELRVRITAVQDVFSLGSVVYAAPQPTLWFNPAVAAPVATLADDCFEAPLFLDRLAVSTSPITPETEQDSRIVLSPVPNQTNVISFRMMQSGPGSPSDADLVTGDFAQMSPSGLLTQAIAAGDFLNPSSPNTITISDTTSIRSLRSATSSDIVDLLSNLFRIDDEFFAFESVVINSDATATLSGIHRAKLDSTPVAHTASPEDRVFFLGLDALFTGGFTDDRFTFNGVVSARPNTTRGLLTAASANTCAFTATNRIFRPYPPKNFKIGTATSSPVVAPSFFPTSLGLVDWDLTWDVRDRRAVQDPDADTTTTDAMEPDTEVVLQFIGDALSPQVRREVVFGPGSPTESFTYTVAQQNADFGASPIGVPIRVKLFSRRTAAPLSGIESAQNWNFVVNRVA